MTAPAAGRRSSTRLFVPAIQRRIRSRLLRACVVVITGLALAPWHTSIGHSETWTNLDGDRSIQARMIGMWNDQVVLQLDDGRSINVPMDKLIATSRIQAGKIAQRLKQERAALTAQIKDAAAKAAAAAPDPLPLPPEAPTYQPPVADMSPDQALDSIREQFQNGHLVVIYDALPPTYRQQLDVLTRLALAKLDPSSMTEPLEQLHGLADLIVTRQNWIRSDPHLYDAVGGKGDLNATGELFQKFVLPAAGLIRAGLPTDQATVKEIRDMGFGAWLHQRDEIIAPYAALLLEGYSSPGPQWVVVETKDDTALLEQPGGQTATGNSSSSQYGESYPGQNRPSANPTVAFQKVEGFWLPANVADGFDGWVKEQTAALEKYEDGSMSLSDWLGGQFVTVPSIASTPAPTNRRGASEAGSYDEFDDQYDDQYNSPESSDSYGSPGTSSSYDDYGSSGSPDSMGSANGRPPAQMEPIAITPAMVGSILQSVGDFRSMFGSLESATDEKDFHAAAEQLIGSIHGLVSLIGS